MVFPDVTIELDLDGWTDVTSDVLERDGITITRGRKDEGSHVETSRCSLTFRNNSGDYSPRNPSGAYYGILGRNTPLRVSVNVLTHGAYGTFESGVDGWTGAGCTLARSTAQAHGGSASMSMTATADATMNALTPGGTSGIPVAEGVTYRVGAWFRSAATSRTCRARVQWYDAAGATVGSSVAVAAVTSSTTEWRESTEDLTAPAGAAFADVRAQVVSPVTDEAHYVDDVTFGTFRFVGVVSSWPVTWDKSGADVTATVDASGVMRRLSQAEPLESALRRGVAALDNVVGYWPCEDGSGATSLGSGFSGHPAARITGTSKPAAFDGFAASAPIPTVGTGDWYAEVPTHAATGEVQVRTLLAVPEDGLAQDTVLWQLQLASGTAVNWNLEVTTGGDLRLRGYSGSFVELHDTGVLAFDVNGRLLWLSVGLEEAGGVTMTISTLEVGESAATTETDSLGGIATVGRPLSVHVNSANLDMGDTAVGHILVQDEVTSASDMADEVAAYVGETAAARILRLAAEEGISCTLVGTAADTAALGPQGRLTVLDLMREAATADMGILYEPRDSDGLTYRTRTDLYAQEPTLPLDYEAGEVAAIESTDDDQQTRNDVTAKREGGGSARAVDEDGTLGVNEIGRYSSDTTLNLELDGDLPAQAAWRLHLGTVDEARYPRLGVNLAAPAFTGDAVQTAAATALDLGDKIQVTSPPAWLPPNSIEQMAQGFAEGIRPGAWTIEATCTPSRPWDVGVYDEDEGAGESRYDTSGAELDAGVTSTATSIDVATTAGPTWGDTDLPYDLNIGGERITVTAVDGPTSPQTLTVTRSVNGVVKAHDAGAAVSLFKPTYYAL